MGNKWTFWEYDPDIPSSCRDHGTCACCGREDRDLVILNDDERICLECFDADYTKCDACGEYWPSEMVSPFRKRNDLRLLHGRDGRGRRGG